MSRATPIQTVPFDVESRTPVETGACLARTLETWAVQALMILQVYMLLVMRTRRPWRSVRILRVLIRKRRRILDTPGTPKLVRCARRYYYDIYAPGWPSRAFNRFVRTEPCHAQPSGDAPAVSVVILKVTRECQLHCRHCLDGVHHSGATDREYGAILKTVHTIVAQGVPQLQLTGGEPLTRLEDVLGLIRATAGRLDVRLHTSGVGLTADVAQRLKTAGLTGIHLSLDHWDPDEHDAFRGATHVFTWVERAARHARASGLLVVLSLCATREFVTRANLDRYAAVARGLGASFIQILEPQAVGAYAGRDVVLPCEQIQVLESWAQAQNAMPRRAGQPVVVYPAARDRRIGCLCAGNRHLYLDERGRMYACPFSELAAGSLDETPFQNLVIRLPGLRCHACPSRRDAEWKGVSPTPTRGPDAGPRRP